MEKKSYFLILPGPTRTTVTGKSFKAGEKEREALKRVHEDNKKKEYLINSLLGGTVGGAAGVAASTPLFDEVSDLKWEDRLKRRDQEFNNRVNKMWDKPAQPLSDLPERKVSRGKVGARIGTGAVIGTGLAAIATHLLRKKKEEDINKATSISPSGSSWAGQNRARREMNDNLKEALRSMVEDKEPRIKGFKITGTE